MRWLFWLWLKGLVLMLLLGPANGLLLKLAHVATVSGLGEISSLFGGVKFLRYAGRLATNQGQSRTEQCITHCYGFCKRPPSRTNPGSQT